MYGSLNYRVRRVGEDGDKSKAANFVVSRFLPPASNSPPSGVAIAPPGVPVELANIMLYGLNFLFLFAFLS